MSVVTQILSAVEGRDAHAAEQRLPLVYRRPPTVLADSLVLSRPISR
jgi:hypothetical protein